MKNIDSISHVSGKSVYVDDIPVLDNTLYALIVPATIAHGVLKKIEYTGDHSDFVRMITASDIPGENQIGSIIPDEELLSSQEIHFMGQAIAIIVAKSLNSAYMIRDEVHVEYDEYKAITDPRVAFNSGNIIGESRKFQCGDIVWADCDTIVSDRVDMGGQEHLYLETHGSYVIPTERGYKVISSTQSPSSVQKMIARVLGISMHLVEVDVNRLGGGFGGKEDQATPIACMAALAVNITDRPVKLILDRIDDLKMTGKRHPYSADYKIGMKSNKIIAYDVIFYQNAGASADLSPAVLERTLFHATNSYYIPNFKATAYSCRTNLPPNTAFRGFGGPQGMFVIEAAIDKLAEKSGIPAYVLQEANLMKNGDKFPYGQITDNLMLTDAWSKIKTIKNVYEEEIEQFNHNNKYFSKGMAIMPITFGISFTNTMMNQGSALVNIYQDGSIGLSTGAVEMGQGVNTRILQALISSFGVSADRVKMETTNTTRAINTSPSAASSTHDLNGWATLDACNQLIRRLEKLLIDEYQAGSVEFINNRVIFNDRSLSWDELIQFAFTKRVDLAAHGYYCTPDIYFDKEKEKGHPFAYYTTGVAIQMATVDIIRGTYKLDKIDIIHDSGRVMNSNLDRGQIEGALAQGLGWMLLEDLQYDDNGRLLSNALSTYKIPDINFMPDIKIEFIGANNPLGLMGSKSIGEPPLMYGIAGYFAVRNAMRNHKNIDMAYKTPLTPERILMGLFS